MTKLCLQCKNRLVVAICKMHDERKKRQFLLFCVTVYFIFHFLRISSTPGLLQIYVPRLPVVLYGYLCYIFPKTPKIIGYSHTNYRTTNHSHNRKNLYNRSTSCLYKHSYFPQKIKKLNVASVVISCNNGCG